MVRDPLTTTSVATQVLRKHVSLPSLQPGFDSRWSLEIRVDPDVESGKSTIGRKAGETRRWQPHPFVPVVHCASREQLRPKGYRLAEMK